MSNESLVITFVQKLDKILQNLDPDFDLKSDRINNVYSYTRTYCKTNPEDAKLIVEELTKNFKYYANKHVEMHPERLQDLLNGMKKVLGLPS